ncbi:LacI family transcriptional regulator [Mycobacterium sp. KBS0706]|uniref:LacI family DNA-binding transcriptional regulator n=1 Tax=Mycobacterium sp. KBS0706 TaxID=2578109 RepID=UPI00110FB1BE|nr:LacI family DNA-binding transcriptional regulator [Mycobacterium sp. KBS0706]TSD86381.1 LacI family transcriptional regulator [Mycobacterium sp. KBS0706]
MGAERRGGRVTLQQIADRVGVSKFAVSRSLSGKDGVSEATRRRVEEAAEVLGYTGAQAGPRDIGFVCYDMDLVNSELRMMVQNGVQQEAHRLGYPLRLQWTHAPDHVASIAKQCAGLLVVGPHDRQTIELVDAMHIPVVRMGWISPLEPVDQVSGTDREAGQAIGQYLLGLGHRVIAFVYGATAYRGRTERYHGIREVTEVVPDASLHQMWFEENGGFVGALRALQAKGVNPTAIFCPHDGLAVTVVSELLRLGYRIPEDVSVIGFGDFVAATQISPQLTTVRVHGAEMGAAAVRLLIERIRQGRPPYDPPQRILIASKIVERRSSGPCPPPRADQRG